LWAATGQAALENARILVLAGSATSTSTLKNLVLPGVGHFTILDPSTVSSADAGNNFFLEGHESIGKSRAEEAVRLLLELNEGVEGRADTRSLKEVLSNEEGRRWVKGFTVIVAHNVGKNEVEKLANTLWEDEAAPPLVVIRSAGFIAEFFIQYHKHEGTVPSSHPHCVCAQREISNRDALGREGFAPDRQALPCTCTMGS
jgi:NEDD8-activating enzyme E1 regulatory subunit